MSREEDPDSVSSDDTVNPFDPPKNVSLPDVRRPSLSAVLAMLIAAIVAGSFAFAVTCFGGLVVAPVFVSSEWNVFEIAINIGSVGGIASGIYLFIVLYREKSRAGR